MGELASHLKASILELKPNGETKMEQKIEDAIIVLADKIMFKNGLQSADALRWTQSALNLAHTLATLDNIKK